MTAWIKRNFGVSSYLLGLILLSVSITTGAYAEDSSSSSAAKDQESVVLVPKKRSFSREDPFETRAGIMFGEISTISRKKNSLMVEPYDEHLPQKLFFLDSQTRYSMEGKRLSKKLIFPRDKVAVRYFERGSFSIADHVFVVHEAFKPADYEKKVKAPPKKAEAKKAASPAAKH